VEKSNGVGNCLGGGGGCFWWGGVFFLGCWGGGGWWGGGGVGGGGEIPAKENLSEPLWEKSGKLLLTVCLYHDRKNKKNDAGLSRTIFDEATPKKNRNAEKQVAKPWERNPSKERVPSGHRAGSR